MKKTIEYNINRRRNKLATLLTGIMGHEFVEFEPAYETIRGWLDEAFNDGHAMERAEDQEVHFSKVHDEYNYEYHEGYRKGLCHGWRDGHDVGYDKGLSEREE